MAQLVDAKTRQASSVRADALLAWWTLLILALMLLPHVALYAASSVSAAFRVAGVTIVGLALAGAGIAVWGLRGAPGIAGLRGRIAGGRLPYIAAAVIGCLAFGLIMRPEWLYAHVGLTLALLLTLAYAALFDGVPPISRFGWIVIGAGVVAVTAVRLYSLSYAPAHNVADEGWILGWALSYVRDGYFHDLIVYHGGADIQRFMLPVAWWISLFGTGFWQTRLFFFFCVMLVIVISGRAAHNLYGSAWITVFVLFSSAVLMSGAVIRHDIGLALAVAASIWLWSEALKRDRAWLHLLAGMMIGLGLFAHYHAIVMGGALLIGLYAPRIAAARRLERGALLFAAGGLIGGLIVVIFQIIPDWVGFLAVRQTRAPVTLVGYVEAFIRHIGSIAELSKYELALLATGVIAAVWRRTRLDVSLALIALIAHIGLGIFAAAVIAPQYVVPLSVPYALLIAGLFRGNTAIQRIGAACFLSIGLGGTLASPLMHMARGGSVQLEPPPAAAWIRAHVGADEKIAAEPYYFLFLTDYQQFISPESPEYAHAADRQRYEDAAAATDISAFAAAIEGLPPDLLRYRAAAWDMIAPDVVVIDANLSTCCNPPIFVPAYLEARGYQLAASIDGGAQPVLIYRKMDS
jgi:hypothetical protein